MTMSTSHSRQRPMTAAPKGAWSYASDGGGGVAACMNWNYGGQMVNTRPPPGPLHHQVVTNKPPPGPPHNLRITTTFEHSAKHHHHDHKETRTTGVQTAVAPHSGRVQSKGDKTHTRSTGVQTANIVATQRAQTPTNRRYYSGRDKLNRSETGKTSRAAQTPDYNTRMAELTRYQHNRVMGSAPYVEDKVIEAMHGYLQRDVTVHNDASDYGLVPRPPSLCRAETGYQRPHTGAETGYQRPQTGAPRRVQMRHEDVDNPYTLQVVRKNTPRRRYSSMTSTDDMYEDDYHWRRANSASPMLQQSTNQALHGKSGKQNTVRFARTADVIPDRRREEYTTMHDTAHGRKPLHGVKYPNQSTMYGETPYYDETHYRYVVDHSDPYQVTQWSRDRNNAVTHETHCHDRPSYKSWSDSDPENYKTWQNRSGENGYGQHSASNYKTWQNRSGENGYGQHSTLERRSDNTVWQDESNPSKVNVQFECTPQSDTFVNVHVRSSVKDDAM